MVALTRIKNNQITDSTVNAAAKLQDYSVTSGKLANNITYGSDWTISGNLTVNGTTTTIDTVNTLIEDPIITLASGQVSGAPAVDIGVLGLRGSQNSSFLGWNEGNTEFAAILTSTTSSNTTVAITAYGNFKANNITAAGNLSIAGNVTGAANFTNTITAPSVVGGVMTGTSISVTGTATSSSVVGGVITGSSTSVTGTTTAASVVGGVITGTSVSVTGNITGANINGNISGNILAAGANTQVQFNNGNLLSASAGFTFDTVGNVLTANGNINGANVSTAGTVTAASVVGGVMTGSSVSVTGNVSGAIVNTPSVVGATVTISTTGNGAISLFPAGTGNVSLNSRYINSLADPVQDQDAATKFYVDSVAQGLDPKASVVYATTGNIFGSGYTYNNGTSGVGATLTAGAVGNLTIDGNVVTVGQRVLIKNEVGTYVNNTTQSAAFNGIYTVTTAGSPSAAYVLTRSADMNVWAEVPNAFTFVEEGATNADTGWVSTASATGTMGTTSITWTQFSGAGSYTAGNALSLNGSQFNVNIDTSGANTVGINGSNQLYIPTGAVLTNPNITAATGTSVSVTGTVTAASVVGGVITGSSTSVTGTTTAASVVGGVITGSSTSVTGTTTAASVVGGVITGSSTSVTGTTTAASVVGGVMTGTSVSVTGNVTGGNILTSGSGGAISGSGNITGGNIFTSGLVSATGNGTFGNITVGVDSINSANGRITVNSGLVDTDIAFNGLSANVFYLDAGANTASFGSATQTVNAIVAFNTTTSILAPVGNTSQRPGTGVTGMLRFNSTTNSLEIFNNSAWTSVGATVFTVVADEQFNGDGATVAFTLGSTQTTNSCIVSINGVVQIPGTAYSVAGTDPTCVLTFTEAPASGDLIDVREITTTTTVTSISNSSGNAAITVSPTSPTTLVTGDLSVTGNINITGNVATTQINNGTSAVQIPTSSGNVLIDVGGTNDLAIFTSTALNMAGNILPQANITYDLGSTTQRWKDLWLSNSTIYLGNAQISANATSLVFTNPAGGQTVLAGTTANSSVAGNVTGGNILTGGIVSATGNITGSYIFGNGALLTGVITSVANINLGTSNVTVVSSGGNVTVGVGGTANVVQWATTGEYVTGVVSATGNITGGNISATNHTGTTVSVSGTVTAASVVGGVITGTSTSVSGTTTAASVVGGVITGTSTSVSGTTTAASVVGGVITGTSVSVSGNVTAGNLTVSTGTITGGNIVNANGNGVGNIGSSGTYFNTVFAKATSAQYADLAEMYAADAKYAPGTVVSFGGANEVTQSNSDSDRRVAGVVSTNPSYIMNAGQAGDNVVAVALTGRVPTSVTGTVAKGDLMVSNGDGTARAEADPRVGTVIGKALADSEGNAVIEVVVGRF